MPVPDSPSQNHLLAALPATEFERLAPHLERVPLLLGETLYEPGEQLQHVYFPTTAIVSLLYVLESGASAEIAGVGNEGVLGISLFMGGDTTPSSAVVQTAGHGYRLPGRLLKEEFNRGGLMQRLLLRYTQALLTQMCQTAACNRHHSIEQQLCRWLLLTLDRLPSNELVMTQELVAGALGVRRESITRGCRKFAARRHCPISPRPHCRARAARAGGGRLRVLRRRQEGTGTPAVRRAVPPECFGHRRLRRFARYTAGASVSLATVARFAVRRALRAPPGRGLCAVTHRRMPAGLTVINSIERR